MLFLKETKLAYPNLKNIFEVGAHRGYDIPHILEYWPEANIYAFEADPFNYSILKDKFKNENRVHIFHLAITDKTEKLIFNRYYDIESILDSETMVGSNLQNTGQGSIMKPGKGMKEIFKVSQTIQEIEVQGMSLKDFCVDNNINSIDAIFMDVQGAEFNVLRGCEELINNLKALIFEWSTEYVMYQGETDFNFIKLYLESHIGMAEVSREYQFQDISGDSLFLKMEGKQ